MLVESQPQQGPVLQPLGDGHHLRGVLLPVGPGDLGSAIDFSTALGLQVISIDEGASPPRATLAAGIEPGRFQLVLLEQRQQQLEPSSAQSLRLGPISLVVPAPLEATLAAVRRTCSGGATSGQQQPGGGGAAGVVNECVAVTSVYAHGHTCTDRTAEVRDSAGRLWRLMEVRSAPVAERLASLQLRVRDMRASLPWYTSMAGAAGGTSAGGGPLGMRCHQEYESAQGCRSALVGWGPELGCTLFELRQEVQTQPPSVQQAEGQQVPAQQQQQQEAQQAQQAPPARFVVDLPDLEEAAQRLQDCGQAFERLQLPEIADDPAGAEVAALALRDPDGWQFYLVEGGDGSKDGGDSEGGDS